MSTVQLILHSNMIQVDLAARRSQGVVFAGGVFSVRCRSRVTIRMLRLQNVSNYLSSMHVVCGAEQCRMPYASLQ